MNSIVCKTWTHYMMIELLLLISVKIRRFKILLNYLPNTFLSKLVHLSFRAGSFVYKIAVFKENIIKLKYSKKMEGF